MIKETMETMKMMKNEITTETAVEKKPVTKKPVTKKPVKVKKDKPLLTVNKWKIRKEVADALTKKYGFGPTVGAIDIVNVSDLIVGVLVNKIPYSVIRDSGAVYTELTEMIPIEDTPVMNEDN